MCDPVTLTAVSTGVAIAGSVAGHIGQSQMADAQARRNEIQAENIRKNFIAKQGALSERRAQEAAATSERLQENQRDGAKARARARVAAGEAGVSGQSVDALLRDFYSRELGFADTVEENFEFNSDQIDRSLEAAALGAESQLNTLPVPQRPSLFGTGLQIAGQAAAGAARADQLGAFDSPSGTSAQQIPMNAAGRIDTSNLSNPDGTLKLPY